MSTRLLPIAMWLSMVAAIVVPCVAQHHATMPHAPLAAAAMLLVVVLRRRRPDAGHYQQNCGSTGAGTSGAEQRDCG